MEGWGGEHLDDDLELPIEPLKIKPGSEATEYLGCKCLPKVPDPKCSYHDDNT